MDGCQEPAWGQVAAGALATTCDLPAAHPHAPLTSTILSPRPLRSAGCGEPRVGAKASPGPGGHLSSALLAASCLLGAGLGSRLETHREGDLLSPRVGEVLLGEGFT